MESSREARSVRTPVVQEPTPALIARILREAIADGRFPPGSQLVEQERAREHAEIVEALDAPAADRADSLLRAHMLDGLERVLGA